MKTTQPALRSHTVWLTAATFVLAITAVATYSETRHRTVQAQEKESAHSAASDQATTLSDQTDLNVTVYNSNIALIRDVRQLTVPTGAISTEIRRHRRHRESRHRPFPFPHRARQT